MKNMLLSLIAILGISILTMAQPSGATDYNPNSKPRNLSSKAQWDLAFNYDISTPSAEISLAGAECDGTYIYAPCWNSNTIVKFDLQGNYLETFTIPGVSGLRDLAFDGTYMYGGAAGTTIYVMDFTTTTLIRSFIAPTAARAIAYNAVNNSLYANNWDSDIIEFDLNGNSLGTAVASPPSLYGLAYDSYTAGGPYLWAFTGTSNGLGCQIEQIDLNTGALTGISHSVSDDLGSTYIAGGLYLYENFNTGRYYIGGVAQGEPDSAFAYEQGITPSAMVSLSPWVLIAGFLVLLAIAVVIKRRK